jgi:hypothetical protein
LLLPENILRHKSLNFQESEKDFIEDFKNTNNIYFSDKYGEHAEYKIIKFHKLSNYNYNIVFKFIANKV